jgi:hypothetical protein
VGVLDQEASLTTFWISSSKTNPRCGPIVWRFILCENPAWIAQVAKLYRKAQSIVVAAMLAYGRQVANTQNVIPQQILLLLWKDKQRFALRGGQDFTAGHAVILMMNSVFGNSDRSGFRDSMSSLILDRWRWLTPNPLRA